MTRFYTKSNPPPEGVSQNKPLIAFCVFGIKFRLSFGWGQPRGIRVERACWGDTAIGVRMRLPVFGYDLNFRARVAERSP